MMEKEQMKKTDAELDGEHEKGQNVSSAEENTTEGKLRLVVEETAESDGKTTTTSEDGSGNDADHSLIPSPTRKQDTEAEVFHDSGNHRAVNEVGKLDYGTSLLQDSIYYDNDIQVRPELIDSLTSGFTEKFLPSLERNRKTVAQIKSSQEVLIETVQQENSKFEECQAIEGLEKTMSKSKIYHAKLLRLRKEMTTLYEKSAKLKKRALRLQQQRQKEELTRAQQMEVEYEREKMLTARVATSSPEKET